MTLEEAFPDDPTKPSLRYAVSTLMPLAIPWTNAAMKIGTPLLESSKGSQFQFGQESAFSSDALSSTPLIFTETCGGQENEATRTGSINSYQDMSVDFSGSIGGSVLGGSARGQFSKNSNKDESVSSAGRPHPYLGETIPNHLNK